MHLFVQKTYVRSCLFSAHAAARREHRRTRGKPATWQHMAEAAGWEGVWTEAETTKDGGISGGLATLTRAGASHGKW